MKQDLYCETLCYSNLGRADIPNRTVRNIRKRYHHNWLLDGIPSASVEEDDVVVTTRYWHGFPVGFVNRDDLKAYVYNHVNIEVMYQEFSPGKYHILRFTVEPFSIGYDSVLYLTPQHDEEWILPRLVEFRDPIASCRQSFIRQHTNYDMITAAGRRPQEANGDVLFTYDVRWLENRNVKWSDRWNVYTTMDNAIPMKVHWIPITNSSFYLAVLAAMVVSLLRRNVRHVMEQEEGNQEDTTEEEQQESLYDKGYTVVHVSHFDPPESTRSIWIMSAFCGTGAQLLATALLTLILGTAGLLHSSERGARIQTPLTCFFVFGFVNAFVSVQTAKMFKGNDIDWKRMGLASLLLFPGFSFVMFLVQQFIAAGMGSTLVIPTLYYARILMLWIPMSPLVFAGAYIGECVEPLMLPTTPRSVLLGLVNYRAFSRGKWKTKGAYIGFAILLNFSLFGLALLWLIRRCLVHKNLWRQSFGGMFGFVVGGLIGLGAVFVELYYILSSIWMYYYYSTFGFLLLVSVVFILSVAAVSIIFNYCQLTYEDTHSWWWQFHCGGSTGGWLLLYSLIYMQQLELYSFSSSCIYIGTMVWMSFSLYLLSGFVGLFSSVWFAKKVFAIAKADSSLVSDQTGLELPNTNDNSSNDANQENPEEVVVKEVSQTLAQAT